MREKANDIKKCLSIVKDMTLKERSYFNKEISLSLVKSWIENEYNYFKWCNKNNTYTDYTNEKISEDLNKYYLNKVYIVGLFKTYNLIKKALKNKKLVLSFRGGLNWDIHYLKNNNLVGIGLITKKTLCGYPLNYNTGYYKMACYGTSRPLEIILSFGYKLGLKFRDIKQGQQII